MQRIKVDINDSRFSFLNENYGGDSKIPASLFPLFERRAENELMFITDGKIKGKEDECIKVCICEMAEFLYKCLEKSGIKSENNDGYSVTYEQGDIKRELLKIAQVNLMGTELLFRGVDGV